MWIPGRVFVWGWDRGERGKGEGDNGEGEALLVLGGFSPFLGCPALCLRPSTVGAGTGRTERKKKGEGRKGKKKKNPH